MAAAAPVRIIVCPPHDAIGALRYTPQYRRQQELPVHLPERDAADGTFERGLAFDDLERCNIFSHKGGLREKCLPIPTWTLNDDATRRVVLHYMEKRTCSKAIGTDRERLVRVLRKMRDSAALLTAQLDRMCGEYVAHLECSAAWCLRRRRVLDLQIKVLDGRLIFCAQPELFYNIIIAFYRTRLMSREIGEKFGISKECVRTILSRMNSRARALGYAAPKKVVASPEVRRMRKQMAAAYRAARAEEKRIRAEQQEASRRWRMNAAASKPRVEKRVAETPKKYFKGRTRERWMHEGKCVGCGGKHGAKREGKRMCAYCAQAFARRATKKPATEAVHRRATASPTA